jgi:tetratricopeptide (TPR) repeat protein
MSVAYEKYRKMMTSGQFEEAARLAESEYLKGDASNPFWLTRQAAALSRAGRHDAALNISQRALALQSANPFAILAVADALRGLKRVQEALDHYEGIAAHPKLSAAAHRGILECLLELKQWDRILELLQQWGLPPAKSHRWRVPALAGLQHWDEAMQACRQWLKLHPNHPSALWNLTELEIQREGLQAVLTRMAKLAKIPSRPPVYKEIYASLCRRAGKPELAVELYAKMTQGSTDLKILRKQAFALSASGKKSQAIAMLEELLMSDPKDYYAHNSYLAACKHTNQLERAAQFYADLVEKYPHEKPLYGRIRRIEGLQRNKKAPRSGETDEP